MKVALVGYGKMGHMIEAAAKARGHEVVCTVDIQAADATCVTADAPAMVNALRASGADGVIELYVNRVLTPQYVFYYGIVEFDPATDKGRMVFVNQKRGASEELPLNADTLRYRNILFRSNVLGDGWLYHWGFRQITGAEWYELRRVNLLTGEVQTVPGQVPVATDPWGTPPWQRVNIYYWGWLRWLPQSRTLIIGNGGQFTAVKVEK